VSGSQTEAQIRVLLVEDMPQVANYIRSLLDTQTRIKLLEVVRDGRQVLDQIRAALNRRKYVSNLVRDVEKELNVHSAN